MAFLARYQPFGPANGLPLSCAATERSESRLCDTDLQKRTDLGAAERRQLHPTITVSVTPHQRNLSRGGFLRSTGLGRRAARVLRAP